MKKLLLAVVPVLLVLLIWSIQHPASTPQTVSSTATSTAKAGDVSLYPDSILTPGDLLTTDAAAVCASGYSSSVRNVPVSEKKQVYAEYHTSYPQPQGSYEVDHFISLELGGSNDIKNLWPEPATPKPNFHEKDAVENYLHEQVCSGKISLIQAQEEIRIDWYAVYKKMQS